MNTMELDLLISEARRKRERIDKAIESVNNAAKLYRDLSVDPDYSNSERDDWLTKHRDAIKTSFRLEGEMHVVLGDLRRLLDERVDAEEAQDGRARLFNCVRQVVSTSNVVPMPFPADHSPEAA